MFQKELPRPSRSHSLGDIPHLTSLDRVPSSGVKEVDPWTAWAYRPRSIIALLVGAAFLVYASGALQLDGADSERGHTENVKRGLWATVVVYLGYALMQAPTTILIRPHPAIWRLVHGLAVVYLVFCTYLLFQTADDARQFLRHLHPDLGRDLGERSYGTDCRIYTPENPTNKFKNVYDTVFDEFVIAHALGWYCKAIMYRNQLLLWMLSVGFELMEQTFNHLLPNFNECWWDSILLDVLLCNWLGIWLGMKTVRYFDGKTYEWVGVSKQPTIMGRLKRGISQFSPATWERDQWNMLSGPKRFAQVLVLVAGSLTVELNAFFLKFCLWIPPTNPLNTYRLILWCLIANPAIREYNFFLQNRTTVQKLGSMCWLSLALCVVETLISIKFGRGMYPKPMPPIIFRAWVMTGTTLCIFLLLWYARQYRMAVKKQKEKKGH